MANGAEDPALAGQVGDAPRRAHVDAQRLLDE